MSLGGGVGAGVGAGVVGMVVGFVVGLEVGAVGGVVPPDGLLVMGTDVQANKPVSKIAPTISVTGLI